MLARGLLRRFLHYLAIIALTVAVSGLFTGSVVRSMSRRQTVGSLSEAALIARNLIAAAEPSEIDGLCKKLGTERLRITVIRGDGRVLGDSEADINVLENHLDREEFLAARQGKLGFSVRTSASVGRRLMYIALPAIQYRGELLIVRASTAVQDLRETLASVYLRILLGTLVMLAAITALAWVVERRMLAPILALQEAARAFASGKLDHYLHIRRPPDLQNLAKSLNRMAENLRRRIAEVTARRNELQAVLAGMVEGVVVLDKNLAIREINPSALRLAGKTDMEAQGRTVLEVFLNSRLHDFACSVLAGSGPQEDTLVLSAGEAGRPREIILQVHGALLPEDGGRIVLVLNDITKLKALETVRRDFVANVSHELKTPITSVKGYLETLLDGALEDGDNARRFLEIAAAHTDRLNAIIEDLLSLSRLEQQEGSDLQMQPCSLEGVARGAIQVCLPKAQAKGIALELACEEELTVKANPQLLEQALTNLIDNAVKFSNAGGRVELAICRQGKQATIAVRDQGIGIPPKDLPRVFERFYRVDKARSRELGGTGLGLAIVKHIVLAHGGSVQAESEPGAGSTFTILLPFPR